MEIHGATEADIMRALEVVNRVFAGNIAFKRLDGADGLRGRGYTGRWNVTLTVRSTRPPEGETAPYGYRRGIGGFAGRPARKIAAACWHVHGVFIDALPAGAVVLTGSDGAGRKLRVRPGDPWNDRDIGSQAFPLMYSEACDCPRGVNFRNLGEALRRRENGSQAAIRAYIDACRAEGGLA